MAKIEELLVAQSTNTFTEQQIEDFRNGKSKLSGLSLLKMQQQIAAQRNKDAVELLQAITGANAIPAPQGVSWTMDSAGKPIDLKAVDVNSDFDPANNAVHEQLWQGALSYCSNERSGMRSTDETGKCVSFTDAYKVSNGSKQQIAVTVERADGTEVEALINDRNLVDFQKLLQVGASITFNQDGNGRYWVNRVAAVSAEAKKTMEQEQKKEENAKTLEFERNLKLKGIEAVGSVQNDVQAALLLQIMNK